MQVTRHLPIGVRGGGNYISMLTNKYIHWRIKLIAHIKYRYSMLKNTQACVYYTHVISLRTHECLPP